MRERKIQFKYAGNKVSFELLCEAIFNVLNATGEKTQAA